MAKNKKVSFKEIMEYYGFYEHRSGKEMYYIWKSVEVEKTLDINNKTIWNLKVRNCYEMTGATKAEVTERLRECLGIN